MKTIQAFTFSEKVTFALLLVLLLLTVPYTLIIGLIKSSIPGWISDIHQLGMYLLLYGLIWIHKSNLQEYKIGKFALWVFILSGTVFRIQSFSITNIIFWLLGLSFFILYIKGFFHTEPQKNSMRWLIVGCFLGLLIPLALHLILTPFFSNISKQRLEVWTGVKIFVIELSWVALFEETVFRGFLWGFLAKKSWNGTQILLFQGALFWIAHSYFALQNPFTFWILVPALALLLGWLAWRSGSVGPGMIMHALYNTLLYFL